MRRGLGVTVGGTEAAGHTSGLKPGSVHPGNCSASRWASGDTKEKAPGVSVCMHSSQLVFPWGPLRVLSSQ